MRRSLAFITMTIFISCNEKKEEKPVEFLDSAKVYLEYIKPIPGKNDSIPAKESQRGEVLIAYSDCHSCHAVDKRMKGPAFKDVAKRYPVQDQYIALLAQRIIIGGSNAIY
jgi:cytochrome c